MLKFLHYNSRVCIGNFKTETSRGVPQGCLTSPLLFNIYIDDIVNKIGSTGAKLLFYADDGIIIAEDIKMMGKAVDKLEEVL